MLSTTGTYHHVKIGSSLNEDELAVTSGEMSVEMLQLNTDMKQTTQTVEDAPKSTSEVSGNIYDHLLEGEL